MISTADEEVSHQKTELSTQQKLDYCLQWENSGMRKAEFCKMHGFSVSRFYYWYHHIYLKSKSNRTSQEGNWTPVMPERKEEFSTLMGAEQVEVILPNQVILRLSLPSSRVVSFIEELSHAAAIIR